MSDIKISQLPNSSGITPDDLLVIVDNPSGNAITKKITANTLRSTLLSEPANLQFNRGTSQEVSTYTPLVAEPIFSTDTKILSIGDGNTIGGIPLNNSYYKVESLEVQNSCGDCADSNLDPQISFTLTPIGSTWAIETVLNFSNTDLEAGSYNGAPVVDFAGISGIKYISAIANTQTIVSGNIPINNITKDLTINSDPITFTKYYVPHPGIATRYEARGNFLLTVTSGNPIFGLKFGQITDTQEDAFQRTSGILTAKRIV